ncbi:MAG TPA: hypothetical protein VHA56_14440 [Mucilaginibacter sp.]|nr:hypothetical protein [Mucilaginibacter sp.]
MKLLILTTIICLFALGSRAQWNTSGNDIYNTNSGNVGIGTSTPSKKLFVTASGGGTSANGPTLVISDSYTGSAASSGLILQRANTAANDYGLFNSQGSFHINYGTNIQSIDDGTTGFTLNSSGNVGIGTSSPVSALQIGGTSGSNFITLAGGSSGSSYGINYTFSSPSSNIYAQQMFDYDNRATRGMQFNTLSSYAFSFNTISNTGGYTGNLLTLLGNGQLGIGTATPSSLVHLYKPGASAILNIENTGNGNISGVNFIRERNSGTGVSGAVMFMNSNTADNNALLYLQAQTIASTTTSPLIAGNGARMILRGGSGAISFENGATESVRFDANGNVGIGTTTPDQKLTVNGQVHATSVVVTSSVPADYVFKSDYNLRPLTEVKAFVDKNHHLPEIPSAADFKKDGQDLGGMNMLLLKKVEELTLYLIEQNKTTAELIQTVKQQQQEIQRLKRNRK